MSVSSADERLAAGNGGAAHHRRFLHKLLAVCFLSTLLFYSADIFAFRFAYSSTSSSPTFPIGDFLGPIAIANASAAPASEDVKSPSPVWISAFSPPNFTSTLLSSWLSSGSHSCFDSYTDAVSIPALDSSDTPSPVLLPSGALHEFSMISLDSSRQPRCRGGDYFETDLSGPSWKSRPPILDHGNGSYSLRLQVHPAFASQNSTFILSIVLLFRSFDGLRLSPERFCVRRELRHIPIKFLPSPVSSTLSLHLCRPGDLALPAWSGRWTRLAGNDSCTVDRSGRYRCLPPSLPCIDPWCSGQLASLESNGWVYSAHCAFRLLHYSSAWRCLNKKWLLFWGDSNHVDTIRNLLNFVLGLDGISDVPRRFDRSFANPRNASESVRITNVFNGHWNDSLNYLGLASLRHPPFRTLVRSYFEEPGGRVPDAVVLNSGLHDGIYWNSVRRFAEGAEEATAFWDAVMTQVRQRGAKPPRVFYRTTVATGGYARGMGFNPNKMEAFDGILKEKLMARSVLADGGVVDEFDMTFPWHYDNRCNDGVHYGRKPSLARWRDGQIGHHYFVDLMLVHVLLNAFCNT